MLSESAPTNPVPRHRPTSRLLVLDAQDRLLLLLVEDVNLFSPRFWITPGGGVDAGESFEQAAVRELWEETGIVAPIGPCVWTRRQIVRFMDGLIDIDERYFVVRVDSAIIDMANVTEWERVAFTEHRWWTLEDLTRTDDVLAPHCLATVLPPIVRGVYPAEPITIGR